MNVSYASPNSRPQCWGNPNVFDPNRRDCRYTVCGHRSSCEEQIVRIRNTQPVQTQAAFQAQQPSYVNTVFQNQAPAPVQQQAPFYQQPVQQPVQQQVNVRAWQVPQPLPQQQHQGSPHPKPSGYKYGWLNDPMSHQIVSNPVPVRPQFEGETAPERFVKNVLLTMAEAFFAQCVLAARQAVLPPRRPRDDE